MDLERSVRVVLGALLGGGGAVEKRHGVEDEGEGDEDPLDRRLRALRAAPRRPAHPVFTALIWSQSGEPANLHLARTLFRLRLEPDFLMLSVGPQRVRRWLSALEESSSPTASAPLKPISCWLSALEESSSPTASAPLKPISCWRCRSRVPTPCGYSPNQTSSVPHQAAHCGPGAGSRAEDGEREERSRRERCFIQTCSVVAMATVAVARPRMVQ
ncbi:hypothetical protein EYF80_065923 [Liparis tanakae]|uniref:Uncharacterized protein n=1 Tax=Liparis tanakae TaxID=230148 RepID=A0A4Z2E5A6_9TELE|nr:hypothetical protein EYF80_065923 [Liparis tanakae]